MIHADANPTIGFQIHGGTLINFRKSPWTLYGPPFINIKK